MDAALVAARSVALHVTLGDIARLHAMPSLDGLLIAVQAGPAAASAGRFGTT
jgi:hypothetical protein